ncbi:MAG: hypothetical protein WCK47_06685 [bacterium]|nr:hypothetical protein [Candidatus Sumerlaeota bacterium]
MSEPNGLLSADRRKLVGGPEFLDLVLLTHLPSNDTISRVMDLVDQDEFNRVMAPWLRSLATGCSRLL